MKSSQILKSNRTVLDGQLAIRDMASVDGNNMVSAWHPTREEIERLIAGYPVLLVVGGVVHPPVMIEVAVRAAQ